MKSKIIAIAASFIVVGVSAVAYAAGWGDVAANPMVSQVATSAVADGSQNSVADSIILFVIGVVGLGAARKHFKTVA